MVRRPQQTILVCYHPKCAPFSKPRTFYNSFKCYEIILIALCFGEA